MQIRAWTLALITTLAGCRGGHPPQPSDEVPNVPGTGMIRQPDGTFVAPPSRTQGGAPVPPPATAAAETISASHLLVQYQGAASAGPTIRRSREEARNRAQEAADRAKKGEPFPKLVAEYSDEPGAGGRGGSLGRFGRGQMVKPFEEAAWGMKPGEISGVVETAFGFHVIRRDP
jgi:hypothetical protein